MMMLKQLTMYDGMAFYDMLQEIPKDENGLMNGMNGATYESFKEWLVKNDESSKGIGISGNMVPQTIYWLMVDDHPVGIGKLRHYLTDGLRERGGHIGYAIRPSERKKGYGHLILKELVNEAKKLGEEQVLLTINNDNTPSIKVAIQNGGVIEKHDDEIHHIWIQC